MQLSPVSRGITTVEILVSVAIMGLIISLTLAALSDFRNHKTTDASVEAVLAAFSRARLDTISSRNDKEYGVHIEATKVVYFVGPTYVDGTGTNVNYPLHNATEIANISLSGGGSNVLYQRLSGKTTQYGTFQVRAKNKPSILTTVTISATGATSI